MRLPLIVLLFCSGICPAAPVDGLIKQLHVRIPMRDRVHLAANIFRPGQPARVPAILVRTPYNKGTDITPNYRAFVERGYAVVVQDVRGRFESDGIFKPLQQEGPDGDDTLTWIARQPWCDGNIGMMGGSYLGIVQWKAALMGNPHLKAIFPVVSGSDDYRDRFYSAGGAMKLGSRLLWMSENTRASNFRPPDFTHFVRTLPLRVADRVATGAASEMFQTVLNHPAYDSFWQSISTRLQIQKIRVPVLSIGGWYDNFVQGDLEAFAALRRASDVHRIRIGPWPHNMSAKFSGINYGPDSSVAVRGLQLEWFDQWLRGKKAGAAAQPPARIFVLGVNRWREERDWPPAGVRPTPFYLASQGRANTLNGNGSLSLKTAAKGWREPDRFTYDPRRPVPTTGGAVCCNPKLFPWGPMDQRAVERRDDVLVYTTEPLESDLQVIGPVRIVLYASTSAPDTDFTAKLVDVFPNGHARNLTDGILRLRYRTSLEKPELAKPGERYKITIDAGVTANVFLKGHRVRLEISSSNFPRFDANPNTGRPVADETKLLVARQQIYHDRQSPSHLLLPVLP